MKRKTPKFIWIYGVAAVLLCLVLATSSLSGDLQARFVSGSEGSDSARVAKFNFTGSGEMLESFMVEMLPGDEQQKKIKINSEAEVALRYTITATSTGNLPLTMKLDGATATLTGEISAGGSLMDKVHTLTIAWPADKTAYTYNREIDQIKITVLCEQMD